jgi:hypothetical protein
MERMANGAAGKRTTWTGSPEGENRKVGNDGIDGTAAKVASPHRSNENKISDPVAAGFAPALG